MLMAPLLSARPTLPVLWPQTEGHFLSNLLGCFHRFCVCHVVPGSLESSREGPLLSVTSVLLVMESSHYRRLKWEGILEICWPISLLWLQEKELFKITQHVDGRARISSQTQPSTLSSLPGGEKCVWKLGWFSWAPAPLLLLCRAFKLESDES